MSDGKKKKTLDEVFDQVMNIDRKVDTLQTSLRTCTDQIEAQQKTLYGTPQDPKPGLVMKINSLEDEIGVVKKVAYALVPGTGAVWIAAQYFLKLLVPGS